MSPRVHADKVQKRLRTPRIPKFSSHSVLFSEALMKSVFLFIQGFFIRLFQLKHLLLRIVSPQFYICFPTSVF